jgi:hypothetical protein
MIGQRPTFESTELHSKKDSPLDRYQITYKQFRIPICPAMLGEISLIGGSG